VIKLKCHTFHFKYTAYLSRVTVTSTVPMHMHLSPKPQNLSNLV